MKKPPHPLRPIYWSFGVMIFLMTLLFVTGVFYGSVLGKIEAKLAAGPTTVDLDTRLSKRIGKTYDQKLHDQLIEALDSEENGLNGIVKGANSLSKAVLQIAGASTLVALWTVFLLVRKSHRFQTTTPTPGDSSSPGS